MTDYTSVIREKRGQAFWITINRPDKRNALNGDVIAGITKGYRDAHDDKDVRVIVLTGAGDKAFCAGADLQNSAAAFAMDFSRPNVDYADLLRLSQNATKPAIARVGGVCMAGGMGLLCMTDMAVAADNVIFGLPEAMRISLSLYDVAGRRVQSLLESERPAGYHVVQLCRRGSSGEKLGPGVYFIRLETRSGGATTKVVVAN